MSCNSHTTRPPPLRCYSVPKILFGIHNNLYYTNIELQGACNVLHYIHTTKNYQSLITKGGRKFEEKNRCFIEIICS